MAVPGHEWTWERGRRVGCLRGEIERPRYHSWRLGGPVLEQVFGWSYVAERTARLRARGAWCWWITARMFMRSIAGRGRRGSRFRQWATSWSHPSAAPPATGHDVPLLSLGDAVRVPADAYVISNTSYIRAARGAQALAGRVRAPVHNWFPPP